MRAPAMIAALSLASAALITTPASADSPIDLTTQAASRLFGVQEFDRAGSAVSLGDVNGDGKDDMAVGAWNSNHSGRTDNGAVYVVFGGTTPPASFDLESLAGKGFRIDGPEDSKGSRISVSTGDIDKDGFDDVIVGFPEATGTYATGGAVFVVFGSANPQDVDLGQSAPHPAFVKLTGRGYAGESVAAADVNDDGYDDVIIGSPTAYANDDQAARSGVVFVVKGGPRNTLVDRTLTGAGLGSAGFWIDGYNTNEQTGSALAVGDVNGDSKDDLVVGAVGTDSYSGAAWVVPGRSDIGTMILGGVGTGTWSAKGPAGAAAGYRLGAGDLNGDDKDDLLIGTQQTGANVGYVVFGRASAPASQVNLGSLGSDGIVLQGQSFDAKSGVSPTGAGDVNADGRSDIAVGLPGGANSKGRVFVIHGRPSFGTTLDLYALGSDGAQYSSADVGEAGAALASGDVNGDRGGDLLIGAPGTDTDLLTDPGAAFLLLGATPPPAPNPDPVTPPPGGGNNPPPTNVSQAATLQVTARAANKRIPRKGKAVLVSAVKVGGAQTASISVVVSPKKAAKKVKVGKTATTVTVKTKRAPKAKVTVKITAAGSGFTPTTFTRTWRIG